MRIIWYVKAETCSQKKTIRLKSALSYMLGLESTLRRKRDRVRKCTIWYVRARDRIIRWVRARKHTPKKMDKYAFFLIMFFDYVCYNVFLGYSPNSYFFPNLKKKKKN